MFLDVVLLLLLLHRPGLLLALSWQTLFCGLAVLCVSGCNAYKHYRALDDRAALPVTVREHEQVLDELDEQQDESEHEEEEEQHEEEEPQHEVVVAQQEKKQKEPEQDKKQAAARSKAHKAEKAAQSEPEQGEWLNTVLERELHALPSPPKQKPRKSTIGPWKQKKIAKLVPA